VRCPYVGGVQRLDPRQTINASATWPVPAVSVADRSYFKTLQVRSAIAQAMLIEPVYSRIHRRLDHGDRPQVTGPTASSSSPSGRGSNPHFEILATVASQRRCDFDAPPRRHPARRYPPSRN